MSMSHEIAVAGHILVGTAGIALYWAALAVRKGGAIHKAAGRAFFVVLIAVALSVGPVLMLGREQFDPADLVQFVYLDTCLITVTIVGWTAIRWKTELARFRGLHFRVLGPLVLVLGLVVLSAGIAAHDPVPMVFSLIGLTYGTLMVRFAWIRQPLHPRWWLGWHLNAVCGLFNAVHGTFLVLMWRWLVDPAVGDEATIIAQLGTMAISVALRFWFGARFNAPVRFSARPATAPNPA
jgi:hypothetical protein